MTIIKKIQIKTNGHTDIIDITNHVGSVIKQGKIKNGIANIHSVGSTGGISTMEYEPGLLKDIPAFMEKMFPYNYDYAHHNTWHDDNGSSHMRSFFIKTSLTVPFEDKKLILGTWQQIILIDFDTRARNRTFVVTLLGD